MVALEQGDALAGTLPEAQTWSDGGLEHAEIHYAHPMEQQQRLVGVLDEA